jgi:hypothetical protein
MIVAGSMLLIVAIVLVRVQIRQLSVFPLRSASSTQRSFMVPISLPLMS